MNQEGVKDPRKMYSKLSNFILYKQIKQADPLKPGLFGIKVHFCRQWNKRC